MGRVFFMSKIMKTQKILLSIAVILYLCFAFVINEINPFKWERGERGFLIALITFSYFLSIPFIYNPYDDDEL